MQFVKFTEENDHEGETWRFWLQLDGNEAELDKLTAVIAEYEAAQGSDSEYQLDLATVYEERFIDVLVRESRLGYMAFENKVTGRLAVPDGLLQDGEYGKHLDVLYKGGIAKLFAGSA